MRNFKVVVVLISIIRQINLNRYFFFNNNKAGNSIHWNKKKIEKLTVEVLRCMMIILFPYGVLTILDNGYQTCWSCRGCREKERSPLPRSYVYHSSPSQIWTGSLCGSMVLNPFLSGKNLCFCCLFATNFCGFSLKTTF